ncbi:glycosyltransferase family 4 protein [Roseiflexus castenholzii]|jgi:glycosyltransferase involved in cell wall biosynthesis|uniref:Glycosyl transferase group 1 n=1 Tax=Roseiflexus castenholzii (strain DSM 13941 / HLO8) TaxID=383372 RepID=A7NNQ0_ROSCS|nr:glycosyltransferase family 1 protein [Roseiflexus castenholzii]ABU59194.1 glycosyl transferase group 1 [Roseiflexus castenholzii DSM 13941]
MRIALITETFLPNVNGIVTTLCRLLEHVQHEGHEALLFAPQGAPEHYAGAQVIPLRGIPFPLYPDIRFTPPQPGIVPALRQFRPDLIHLAGLMVLGPAARFAAQQLRIPAIATYHTDLPAYSVYYGLGALRLAAYSYLRWIHNACALTLCPSSAILADLRKRGFRRLRLWGRGVDTIRFHPAHRRAEWRDAIGARANECVLLYVGRLAAEKRLDLLAEALRDMEGIRLVLVGDGPARQQIERRFAGMPVTFTGFLNGHDLAVAYASSDLFVFPSDTETFGQVVQEAMASGLPVVAARAGGVIDLVRNEETGVFFAPGSAYSLRTAVNRLVANPGLSRAYGQAGRAAAERRSWTRVLDELMEYYRRALRWRPRLLALRRTWS